MMATKRKLAKVAAPVKQGAKMHTASRIDESRTAVSVPDVQTKSAKQVETIEISSDSESIYDDVSDLDDDEAAEEVGRQLESEDKARPSVNGDGDAEMRGGNQDDEESDAEPTFGDLIRNHETVDVAAALAGQQSTNANTALTAAPPRHIAPPSTSSLGTVLAQALRTDDADLLESCFHTSDVIIIRNTIQRLDSSLAGALLTQLASRLHRRPGRAHNLMAFVQWTLIAHGGALATQPDIQKRLAELNRVLEERTRGLNSLLALKGKLDMLEAQMALRRGNRSRRHLGKDDESESDEDEDNGEEGIVYVEGQEYEAASNGLPRRGDEEDDDFPVVNGVASDSEEDSEDEDEDDMEVDEFAEESLDEDEVDHDDIEDDSAEEEDESEVEAAPPAKIQKKSKSSFTKKR